MTGTATLRGDLAPVIAALRQRAHHDSDRILGQAREQARERLTAANGEAERIRGGARDRGASDAAAVMAAEAARGRRRGRELILRHRRQLYEQLRRSCHEAVAQLPQEPELSGLTQALAELARRELGPGAVVTPLPDGGVVAAVPGRRLELSLRHVTDAVLAQLGDFWEEAP